MINKIITDGGYKQQENMTENIASGIVDFDQNAKRLKTSEKTFTAKSSPSMSLEKSMDLGHDEDILFLISQTEGNNHNLVGLGYIKLCFVFPNGWKVERQNRCRTWLTENLGFTESLLGNSSVAYSNNRTKVDSRRFQSAVVSLSLKTFTLLIQRTDLCKAGKKVMEERNTATAQQVAADAAAAAEAAQSTLTLEVPDEQVAKSRPTSLNMSRPTSLNMSTIQRVMSTDSTSGRNSGNKRSHRDSMTFRDTGGGDSDSDENGAYSPKSGSGRTSRSSQSPFFMSNRSPRGMTASPMDPGLTTGLTSMRLDTNSTEPEPRVMTRSRGNSNSTMMVALSRSRGNSDSTLGESVSTKSRNGSLDLGRCASRTGPAIKEESQEDLDEDLDKEVASFLPNSTSAGSLLTMEQQAAAPISNGIAAGTRFAGDFFTAPTYSRSPLPLAPKVVKRSPVLTTVEGDEAVDIPSDTSTMRDSDEENDEDEEEPGGAGNGDHCPMSPSGASAGQQAHERSSTPPAAVFPPVYEEMAPSEMTSQIGMHYEIGLSGGGNSPPSAMAMRRPLPSGPFTRRIPSPQRPLRKFVRSQTAPLPSSQFENSPGATVPAAGLGLSAGPFFHTPQAVRPADTFHWENTQSAPEHQLARMREAFRTARLEYDRVKKIPLIRSKSEGNHSPSDGTGLCASHWDSDFMPAHSSRVSSFGIPFGHLGGRDSIGSVGGGVSSCPFQALTNDRGSGAHLMVCEDEMGMLGCSPIQVGIQVAQQALRDRRPSRPSSSNSVLGMYPSPQAAFSTVSPKHSHQHVNNALTHLNHSPGSMLVDAPTSIHGVALAAGFTPVFANSRLSETWKIKKRQSSVAKSRRMSVAALPPAAPAVRLHAIAESSFAEDTSYLGSPGPKTKCLSASKARAVAHKRHSSIFSSAKNNLNYNNNYNNTSDVLGESSFAHHSGCDSDLSFGHNTSNTSTGADSSLGGFASDSHFFHPSSRLNEHNFKGIVIGGVYQHCFDNASPLVAAPTGSDKRVVDVSIQTDNSLVLSLYQPRSKSTKQIELGAYWQWMRCSPTGYLAFRSAIEPHHKTVCYFLPKHPDDWKDKSAPASAPSAVVVRDGRVLRNRRVSIVPQHEFNPRASQSFSGRLHNEIEMDFQPMNAITALPSIETDTDVDGDNEMQSDNENEELNLSGVHAMDNDLDLPNLNALDLDDAASAQSEHWSNPNILALIFDFLIDDAVLFGAGPTTPTAAAGTSSRPASRRARKPSASNMAEVAAMQLQTCQTVNKTFALATYMVIAQRKSSLSVGARLSFDYARFKKFATKFQEGMYLSEGVCKNVYCVLNPATANLEAVSVMDIDDLKSRAMDVAITQELKISLLCSALVNLKICPNLVQVYSLFQADCDAPSKLWGAKRSFEDMRNPLTRRSGAIDMRKGDVTLGSYQYIRMEFCSGGDVEDRVRAVGLPDLPTVQGMFFQMCFSLYACREKLCMRHFDIKLLNFFVTTPDILHYSPSAAKQAPAATACAAHKGTTNLQIALGEHVYNLPLQANSLSLIKLADFGTSAVGTMGLGDCITMQQVRILLLLC